ncbi:3-oxoadipate enol-lactonase (plasmid) [Aliirhizobium terrae]|uniref:3-oxoadipate enol-lactonase n=1 Tax=Terrirhizobium terrae TaxID=2926709 RepID=UPI002577EC29|nr:3-oxoadipate enol-lactonase [Rhizobium sp. CC-CFT758]WJH38100.1 3-oxoadipate enol-lactonase [Rhizobium sp. CC-CFT758]
MHFATVNGIAIQYDVRLAEAGGDSDAPAIVFINSLGTDFRIWDQVREKLSDDFTTLVYDKRGHGLSGLGHPPYSICDHVEDLAGLLDLLDLRDVVLCGLSVGGLIAQGLCAVQPERVRGLVLSNTAAKIGNADMWAARMAMVAEKGIGAILEDVMARWFTPTFRRSDNAAYHGYCAMLLRQPAEGYAGTCAAIRDADFTTAAGKIAVPTLCIAGSQDGSTPPAVVKGTADLIAGARYELIDDAAHLPCIETPAVHAAIIRDFVQGLRENQG